MVALDLDVQISFQIVNYAINMFLTQSLLPNAYNVQMKWHLHFKDVSSVIQDVQYAMHIRIQSICIMKYTIIECKWA